MRQVISAAALAATALGVAVMASSWQSGALAAPPGGNGNGNGNGGGEGGGGGGGDCTPPTVWMVWYDGADGAAPECGATDPFAPLAPEITGMGPGTCCISGGTNPDLRSTLASSSHHFSMNWQSDFCGGPVPCPDCPTCGEVIPEDAAGDPVYALDTKIACHLDPDGNGGVLVTFLASGTPDGGKKEKRWVSDPLPVKCIVDADDVNPNGLIDPWESFTLIVREPSVALYPQTGPGEVRFISVGDVRFDVWTPPAP